jgi:hypothetical protein
MNLQTGLRLKKAHTSLMLIIVYNAGHFKVKGGLMDDRCLDERLNNDQSNPRSVLDSLPRTLALDIEKECEYYMPYELGISSCEAIRGVAQPGSASALGAESRRFKSSRPDHFT